MMLGDPAPWVQVNFEYALFAAVMAPFDYRRIEASREGCGNLDGSIGRFSPRMSAVE
jgi:hypothetical protein